MLEAKMNLFLLILSDVFLVYLPARSLNDYTATGIDLKVLIMYLLEDYEHSKSQRTIYIILRGVEYSSDSNSVQTRIHDLFNIIWSEVLDTTKVSDKNIYLRDVINIIPFTIEFNHKSNQLKEKDLLAIKKEIFRFKDSRCFESITVTALKSWDTLEIVFMKYCRTSSGSYSIAKRKDSRISRELNKDESDESCCLCFGYIVACWGCIKKLIECCLRTDN